MAEQDLYADGWDTGYRLALRDYRAELGRITHAPSRLQAESIVVRLLAQHRTQVGAAR